MNEQCISIEELNDAIRKHCLTLHNSGAVAIAAEDVAAAVYSAFDPHRTSAAFELFIKNDFRRRSEAVLRRIYDTEAQRLETGQQDALPDQLQSRYPCERSGRHVFVQPHDLSDDEIDQNVNRLREEGKAKIAHADALEAYKQDRRKAA